MSRPDGLHTPLPLEPDTLTTTTTIRQQDAQPRGPLVLLLGSDLANSPLLSSFISIALADSLATLALFLPFLFLPELAKSSGIEADKVENITLHQNQICVFFLDNFNSAGSMACSCSRTEQLIGKVTLLIAQITHRANKLLITQLTHWAGNITQLTHLGR